MPSAARWFFAVALVINLMLLLAALALTNITSAGPSQRALAHSVAILTEVDSFLDERYPAIQAEAQETNEASVPVRGFPVEVAFTPSEVAELERSEFREELLNRAAAVVHDNGLDAFSPDSSTEVDSVSMQGAVRAGLDFLRPTPHRVLTWVTAGLAIAAAVLTVGLALSTRGWGRLTAIGLTVLVASAPFLVLSVALRFMLRVAADGSDDYVVQEFLQLAQELDWAAIRQSLIFTIGGSLFLGVAIVMERVPLRTEPTVLPSD
jgi:hypothetical protein